MPPNGGPPAYRPPAARETAPRGSAPQAQLYLRGKAGTARGQGPWGGQPQQPPRRKGKTALIATFSALALLGTGGGIAWYVTQSGTPNPVAATSPDPQKPEEPKKAEPGVPEWSVPLAGHGTMDFTAGMAFASWLTDTTVIRAQKDAVLAYALNTGKQAWNLPAPGKQLCGATPELSENAAAIAYMTDGRCDQLAGLDAATGKLTWKTGISSEKSSLSGSLTVPTIMSTANMAVVQVDDTLTSYRLSDGGNAWTWSPRKGCYLKDANSAPDRVVVLLDCDGGKRNSVQVLHPATGRVAGKYPIGDIPLMNGVLSAKPIVIHRKARSGDVFTVYASTGKVSEFNAGSADMRTLNSVALVRGGHERRSYAVHGDRLYLATKLEHLPKDGGGYRNKALAFDLKTGRRLWQSTGTSKTTLSFIRADEQGLLALEVGDWRELAPRLVRFDPATGKAQELATLPLKYGTEADRGQVYERDGAVIIVPWTSVVSKNAVSYIDTNQS
ncbi:PQQ-binding-like beta-propeller repeat protein [Nonomuraea sp. NPDC049725]|uniref:outer membrane protein assembly factor BamB family protein n=1 Tax=Nonomuraea sp. NPDC049725 TaxID=3154508 RepID=UPI00344AA85D